MEFIDVKAQYEAMKTEIDEAIQRVLASGHFIMGPEVEKFEQAFAALIGVKHAIACGNGTDALQLLYMAYGLQPNDAIFVPDVTFIATHEPACMLGGKAVFCDIEEDTYNISPAALEKAIEQTLHEGNLCPKFVVGVDFLGNPCDYAELVRITEKYHLILLEDAAQSIGAEYQGRMCGAFGHSAATSFFPTKPLGCYGDGGAVLTNDGEIAATIRSLQMHGKGLSKYDNVRIGCNSRLDALQAAVLQVKLQHFGQELQIRQQLADVYNEAFFDILTTPVVKPGCKSSYAQYVVRAASQPERDFIREELRKEQIPTLVYYPKAIHQLPVFQVPPLSDNQFPNATRYVQTAFSLPFSPHLAKKEQNQITRLVKNAVSSFRSQRP